MKNQKLIERILKITAFDFCDDIWWKKDKGELAFFARCDDLFVWACSDLERIDESNIDLFEKSYEDTKKINSIAEISSSILFCCRSRKMRPQGAYYTYIEKDLWPLFDACGPEREINFGNPYKPGQYNPTDKKKDKEDIYDITRKFIQCISEKYKDFDTKNLNQVFMRGPFAGWSERNLLEFSNKLKDNWNNFPPHEKNTNNV